MAYTYAREKSSFRHLPAILGVAVICFPVTLSRLDFRRNFSNGLTITTNHQSPAFSALEDLDADFSPELNDLGAADLPTLGTPARAVAIGSPESRYLALEGVTIHRPANAEARPSGEEPALELASGEASPDSSLAQVTERLVRRELQAAQPERILASTSGTKIIVRGSAVARPPRGTGLRDGAPFRPRFEGIATAPLRDGALWLDGRLEMTGGLAFTGDDVRMVVQRRLDGRTIESGQIWVTEGRFEIHVSRPTGQLVAELRARGGRVLGRGEINLAEVGKSAAETQTRVGDLTIALRPTADIASVRAISAYSHREHKIGVPEARVEIQSLGQALHVDEEGLASAPELGRDSTFLARAEARGYRPTLAIARADETRDVRLMSNAMAHALIELERRPGERERTELAGLVWGSVTAGGVPVAGARVEMSGGIEPVYFNDLYLPDRSLTATSANGLFAFLDVPTGVQAVRVARGDVDYPAQVLATEDQHVSAVDLELRDEASLRVRVIDALAAGARHPASLRLMGTDASLRVDGDATLRFATSGPTTMIEADAGDDYEVSRVNAATVDAELTLPLVRREWLNGIFASQGLAPEPGRGSVVGFIDEQDFEVEMTGAVLNEKLRVVYFDAEGRVLAGGRGRAGGGFAILNAPAGLQTVRIQPTQSRESHAEVVVAEPNLVHVLTWRPPAG